MAANSHIEYADRKNGRKPVVSVHPELAEPLEEILGETYHLVVYQEQVMAIAQKLAGYSLGAADLLRRAMGKKKKEILDASYAQFVQGMRDRGYSQNAAQAIWDVLVPFSGYGFNKSHTAGYGVVSFWTAYLKANYPAEFMAALLTSVGDDKDKMAIYLADCRKMGIKVLPPDVNESDLFFTPVGTDIRFGMGAVRNVGANVVASIVRVRHAKGKYASFVDFLSKSELVACNKRVLESLIKAGAFDSLGHTRRSLINCHDQAIDVVVGLKKQEAVGQFDLFGSADDVEPGHDVASILRLDLGPQEWNRKTLLAEERSMLGLYVSGHPLDGAERILERNRDITLAELADGPRTEGEVKIAGIIASVDRRVNKQSGKLWAIVTIEDLDAAIEVLFFPKSYEYAAPELVEDAVVAVSGRLNERDGTLSIFGQDLFVLDVSSATTGTAAPVTISLRPNRITPPVVEELKRILLAHPGASPVQVRLEGRDEPLVLAIPGLPVDPTSSFLADIKTLLGAAAVAS
jgi:DNA polymerase-3 subunit alpha